MRLVGFSTFLVLAGLGCTDAAFNRIATYNVCEQLEATCNIDDETAAEIVVVTEDGMTLIYSDSPGKAVGMVDITDPMAPVGIGRIITDGEPTSVAVLPGTKYVVTGVNQSPDYINVKGQAIIIDAETKSIVHAIDLPGQPDSVAVSPDGMYVAIAIENERDEDLGDGAPPQLPPGALSIITVVDKMNPTTWTIDTVEMTGLDNLKFPEDPEPEYVSINDDNIAVVTAQENNGLVLVDLTTATIIDDFSAGTVNLTDVDTVEEGVIDQSASLYNIPREPDAVTWIGNDYFATADEGDLDGGSRGFTIFDKTGAVVYTSGSEMEWWTARIGHYPEERSENKGNEPEGILYKKFGDIEYLFVLSERSSVVFVYDVSQITSPSLIQILPAGVGPEGVVAIPSRNLLVVANEKDDRGDKMRANLSLYKLTEAEPTYPTLLSAVKEGNVYIPFAALSGLTATSNDDILYAVDDSFFKSSRILKLDVSKFPAELTKETFIMDKDSKLKDCLETVSVDGITVDVATMINEDLTVNIDPEGISASSSGGFWIVSEGRGNSNDASRPFEYPNLLLKVSDEGAITQCVLLPETLNNAQFRFGFEGCAESAEDKTVLVVFQRAWGDEPNARLGLYDLESESWTFAYYPLDTPESQNGGWVGLSDISNLGDGKYLVLERDNQGGPDAAIKRLYQISVDKTDFKEDPTETLEKTLKRDLMDDLKVPGGNILEKIEGLAVTPSGFVWINSDNDGVDDSSGEHQLLKLPLSFEKEEIEVDEEEMEGGEEEKEGESAAHSDALSVGVFVFGIAAVFAI